MKKFNEFKHQFIVFEGIDGAGKDLQMHYLAKNIRLRNKNIINNFNNFERNKYANIWITREPTLITKSGIKIAKLIKQNVLNPDTAQKYFIEDRIEHTKIIKNMLKISYVLCSRYDISTFTYQITQKQLVNNNKSFNFEKELEDIYKQHKFSQNKTIIPDITIILKVKPTTAFKRMQKRIEKKEDIEIFEKLEFLKKAHKNMEKVINWWQKKHRKFLIINGNNSPETISKEIMKKIKI